MTEDMTNLMGLARAARTLAVDPAWLREEAAAGRIPGLRAGRSWLFRVDVLRELFAERAAQPVEREEVARGN